MVVQWISHRAKLDSATEGRTHLNHNQTHFVSSPPCSSSFLKSRQAEFKSPLSPFPASSQEMRWSWSQRENHIPLAWASCPQALSWSLKLGHSWLKPTWEEGWPPEQGRKSQLCPKSQQLHPLSTHQQHMGKRILTQAKTPGPSSSPPDHGSQKKSDPCHWN